MIIRKEEIQHIDLIIYDSIFLYNPYYIYIEDY